jgi:hypothetical protein
MSRVVWPDRGCREPPHYCFVSLSVLVAERVYLIRSKFTRENDAALGRNCKPGVDATPQLREVGVEIQTKQQRCRSLPSGAH